MKNLGQMMKQAQQMQAKMAELQDKLAESEMTGAAGGGMVQVTMNGKGELRAVKIDPSLLTPADAEVLEDLIVAAANDAKAKVETHVAEEMQKLTGGLALPPGMKLPF
jgi:DNA-binding YbaB/EbfC family protein